MSEILDFMWTRRCRCSTTYVNQLTAACFGVLRQIRSIRRCLSSQACTTLVTCLIFAWLDYCNTVFASRSRREINRLQSVQNAPVRLVAGARKYDHVTPLLLERHWLPIEQRVLFKLGVTMFKIVNNMAPSYLSEYAKPVSSLSSSSLRLRSADDSQLFVPRTRTTYGDHALPWLVLGCGTVCQPPSDPQQHSALLRNS